MKGPKPKITGRYEHMMERASSARLPFMQGEDLLPASSKPPVIHRPVNPRAPKPEGPSEMSKVIFGSFAPSVQPALNWFSTRNGGSTLATGAVALGALAITRLMRL